MYWTMIGTPLHLRIPPAVGHATLASGQLRVILDLARTWDLSTWVKKVESVSVVSTCHFYIFQLPLFYHGLQIAKLPGGSRVYFQTTNRQLPNLIRVPNLHFFLKRQRPLRMDKDGVGRLAWSLEATDISFEVHLGAATKQQTEHRYFSSSSNLQVRYATSLMFALSIRCLCPNQTSRQSLMLSVKK